MSDLRAASADGFRSQSWQQGKTLVEFTLLIPVILLLLVAIIDFGRILFTYAQAINSLREGLRYAEVLGSSNQQNYLDCTQMRDTVSNIYFADIDRAVDITITYVKARSADPANPVTYGCEETGSVLAETIDSGDILQISMNARLPILVVPGQKLEMSFSGQRTIIKSIKIGSLLEDNDQDGLNDLWEKSYFTEPQNALDDPDGDACNNGCEELRGTDPTVNDNLNDNPALTAGMTVPAAPAGFLASQNCETGQISFSWSAPGGSATTPYHVNNRPFPDLARIYEVNSTTPVIEINSVSAGVCDNCLNITASDGQHTYYLVFYKQYRDLSGSDDWLVQSVASSSSTATCDPPAAPTFFTAQPDCTAGIVSFSWTPPIPKPDAYEIYRTDGTLVRIIAEGGAYVCLSCDTIGSQQAIDYWIVARLGTQTAVSAAPYARASCGADDPVEVTETLVPEDGTPQPTPSPELTATPLVAGCGAIGPQGGSYSISGHIFMDRNGNGRQAGAPEPDLSNIGVRIIWAGEDNNFDTVCDNGNPIDQHTNEVGDFLFAGLRPGLYRIELIALAPYERVTTENYPHPNIMLGPDQQIIFGLQ